MKTAIPQGDFRLDYHGSIYLLHPLTVSGRKWVEENVCQETGIHPYFPTIIVEPQFLPNILSGIRRDRMVMR